VYCITDNRLYLDSNGTPCLAYKIGKADDAAGRTLNLRSKETFIDEKFKCIFLIKSENNSLESQFHEQFKVYRVSNMREWFIAPIESVMCYAKEVCSYTGSVFIDYAKYIESADNPKNMSDLIKYGAGLDMMIVSTNKPFQSHTREHTKERIEMIRKKIEKHNSQFDNKLTGRDLLNLKLTIKDGKGEMKNYNKSDLCYDIESSYFNIV